MVLHLINHMALFGIGIEYLAAIIATVYYKKFASKYTALLVFLLWYTCVTETTSHILTAYGHRKGWLYFIYVFFEFNTYLLMYYSITKIAFTKKIIKIFMLIFNLIYLFEILKYGVYYNTSTVSVVVGSFFLSIVLILYLKEFLYSDKILNYSRSLYFWTTIGALVYYLGSIPFQAIIPYLKNRNLYFIQYFLGLFSLFSIIIGFLWSKRETK